MKHAISPALALVLGLGLAAGAQAHGIGSQSAAPAKMQQSASAEKMSSARADQPLNRQDIIQAQQALQSQGLYKGRIDGRVGRGMRTALTRFQKQNGLPRTARLDHATFDRLTGGAQGGVGSSMPSDLQTQTPVTPPATQTPGAGGSNAPPTGQTH